MKDIASEAGITRELFYYYYSGKRDVIDAVLDDYVADIVESVAVWNETRHFGDTSASLRECIATLRRTLYDANGPRPDCGVGAGVKGCLDVRAVRETANFICEKVVSEYERYHDIKIDLVYETMRHDLRLGRPSEGCPFHQRRSSHEGGRADVSS